MFFGHAGLYPTSHLALEENGFTPQQNWLPSTQRLLKPFFERNIYVSFLKNVPV
jgi:hypothetical protein